jgi:hypothetical protein
MLLVRVAWVFAFREIDSDPYGHFFIAIAARRDPTNINVHWVWLPLYHFVVGALTSIGLTFRGLRVMNALLATLPPLLVWRALERRNTDHALRAALLFAISPLLNILGQSANPETVFLVFICAALAAATPVRAGIWLALACMIRYEAWGAVLALCVWTALRERASFMRAAIPAAVVALYILFRWHTDGTLLLFLRGTRDITKVQTSATWTFRALIEFPFILPCVVLGPAIVALPLGIRTLTPFERILAIGFAAFLLLSYYAGGSHAGERYLVSLTPFAWIAIAVAGQIHTRRNLLLVLVALTTMWHLHRAARMAIDWNDGLREREEKLEQDRVRP